MLNANVGGVTPLRASLRLGDDVQTKWLGEWAVGRAYLPLEKVSRGGSSYVCTRACTAVDPLVDVGDGVEGQYWLLIAQKGDDGEGIENIEKVGGGELVDGNRVTDRWEDFRITYADGRTFDYRVYGGGDGKPGPAGTGISNIRFKETTEDGNVYQIQVGMDSYTFTAPKGDKGDSFTYEDFTQEQLDSLEQGARTEAEKAAASASAAAKSASSAATAQSNASNYASNAKTQADRATSAAKNAAQDAVDEAANRLENQVGSLVKNAQNAANNAQNAAATATQKANEASSAASTATNAAGSADNSATKAEAAKLAIENMTVDAETLAPTEKATVEKTADGNVLRLTFGLPKGDSGVYLGIQPPESANVWIDPSGSPDVLERWTFELSDGTMVEKDVFAR